MQIVPGVQLLMHIQSMNCKHSQGAADVRRRVHRRSFVLQVLGNRADAVPCECLRKFIAKRVLMNVSFLPDKSF